MRRAVLVADIHGVHRVLEEHGPDEAVCLIEHFAVITQEVIESLGGSLVHIWAGQAFVLFRTPAQAVRAALEAHRRYEELDLPAAEAIGVGIGIAAGVVTWVTTGYMGVPVDRAEHLCALAEPGQTLIGPVAREETRHMCGVRFHDLGRFRVLDVEDVTEVAAVSHVPAIGPPRRGIAGP